MYMNGLFSFCSSLKSLPDISKWKTDNVILMTGMFYSCRALQSIPDISKWNFSNVDYYGNIFANCISLKIPFQYQFNLNSDYYNIRLSDTNENKITIVLTPDTRINQLLIIYFLSIGKFELINDSKIKFFYNYKPLEFGDYRTIGEVFKNKRNPEIMVR